MAFRLTHRFLRTMGDGDVGDLVRPLLWPRFGRADRPRPEVRAVPRRAARHLSHLGSNHPAPGPIQLRSRTATAPIRRQHRRQRRRHRQLQRRVLARRGAGVLARARRSRRDLLPAVLRRQHQPDHRRGRRLHRDGRPRHADPRSPATPISLSKAPPVSPATIRASRSSASASSSAPAATCSS